MNGVLFKIAFRNLREHKTKTLIIGILITLGIAILVVGNSFMDTVQAGIKTNYIENYTGDIFVASSKLEDVSLIMSGELFESKPKTVPTFPEVQEYVESNKHVVSTTGQINGVASAKWGELGEGFMLLFGVESESYQNMFPNGVNITEGEFLAPGEEGVVLSTMVAEMFNETADEEIKPGDKIVLTMMNQTTGAKIREVTVRGIHDYGEASFDLSFICFIDEGNLRTLNGMVKNTAADLNLSAEEESTLGSLEEDDLFGSDDMDSLFGDSLIEDAELVDDGKSTEEDWLDILGDTSGRAYVNETDPDAWNYMLIKLDDNGNTNKVLKDLNGYFVENEIDAVAYEWITGAGMSARMADSMSIVFNVLLFIIAIVAVIVIMNTLVISVSERYGEIGTMRAIGAKKSFVRQMISIETLMITIIFGLLGVILGVIILLIMGAVGIEATNQFLQILLGGDIFRPEISGGAILLSVIMISVVGVISSLYPVSVALKISPLEAMNKNG